MDRNLKGKVVVITGASSGFGKGCARDFARLGAAVVLAARREELLDELAAECSQLGGDAIVVPTDVSKRAEMEALFNQAIETYGQIDIWINNAGGAAIGLFSEIPLDDHEQVLNTNLAGTVYGSYFAMKHFTERGIGTLINIASMIGRIPAAYYSSYSAAKHGVLGLCGALREEVHVAKLEGVHVCAILPMAMDTPFFDHAANYSGKKAVPIPPVSDAQEVVDAIIDLAFNPKAEVPVGKASGMFSVSDSLMPGATEAMMGANTKKTLDKAPPAANTKGNLEQPTEKGSELHADKKRQAS